MTPQIILGCAQIGMRYGIANKRGKPNLHEAMAILHLAADHDWALDTASVYGDSEQIIGAFVQSTNKPQLQISTKVSSFKAGESIKSHIVKSLKRSPEMMKVPRINCLFLHDFRDFVNFPSETKEAFDALKSSNLIQFSGISVYTPSEAQLALESQNWDVIQIPFNILDTRWLPFLSFKSQNPSSKVWVRSIYLQGLCLTPPSELPLQIQKIPTIDQIYPKLTELCMSLNRSSLRDLCLNYTRSISGVDALIGCETVDQIRDNLALLKLPILNKNDSLLCQKAFTGLDELVLDPRRWG